MSVRVEIVVDRPHRLGESPLWDHRSDRLLWIDCLEQQLHSLDPASGALTTQELPRRIGSIGLRAAGGLVAGTKGGFATIDLESGGLEVIAPLEADRPDNRLNDGKVDPAGRYWCGSMNENFAARSGALYRLDADHAVTEIFGEVLVSNGIAFSPEGDRMYFADSRRELLFVLDYDQETGRVSNRRIFVDFRGKKGRADGATVDREGNYWCALVFGAALGCFSPAGDLLRTVELPVAHPTMCAFGGPDLDLLYVTSATCLAEGESLEPHAGALFAVNGTGARGLPEPLFAG